MAGNPESLLFGWAALDILEMGIVSWQIRVNVKREQLAAVLFGIGLLIAYDKPEIVLAVNSNHHWITDIAFKYLTYLGEAPIIVLTILLSFLISKKHFVYSALSFAFLGVVMYFLKFHLFSEIARPRALINNDALMHFIEGVTIHLKHSFPSGHTTTAFLGFYILSSFTKQNWIKLMCFFLACLVGYSRMYLGQHFFVDVFSGSTLGILIGVVHSRLILLNNNKGWI